MERAVLLLNNTTLSIEEIASMLGYSNNSNFYKAFREYYGMSPREYEKEIK
ncbi:MAG: helix-turn-helix domain-containing protein [Lachnospiraceae bacterium]|nr:helix-turn-helix domain-containing protein [Lachnospiraceae bacterium]